MTCSSEAHGSAQTSADTTSIAKMIGVKRIVVSDPPNAYWWKWKSVSGVTAHSAPIAYAIHRRLPKDLPTNSSAPAPA